MEYSNVKYLGGLPYPFIVNDKIRILIDYATGVISFIRGNNRIDFYKTDILDVRTDIRFERSLGKGIAGYIIGRSISKKYGGLIGTAIGARRRDESKVYLIYVHHGRNSTIVLDSGNKSWKLYSGIMGLIAG